MRLRTYLINILVIFAMYHGTAQLPSPGSIILRPELDKFEGVWKWDNGAGSEVIIKLKKINFNFTNQHYNEDILLGSHKYIQAGVVVEDYLPDFTTISQASQSSITFWTETGFNTNHITGTVKDLPNYKKVKVNLDYIPGSPPTMTWQIFTTETFVFSPSRAGFTLPITLVFVKQ